MIYPYVDKKLKGNKLCQNFSKLILNTGLLKLLNKQWLNPLDWKNVVSVNQYTETLIKLNNQLLGTDISNIQKEIKKIRQFGCAKYR